MTTGELIRAARKKAGLTQKELGSKLGVSGAMIAQYETGVRTPKVDTIQKIAIPLGVSWTDLYEMPDNEIMRPKSDNEHKKNLYTEMFFHPGIQKTAAAYRTNGFTEYSDSDESSEKKERHKRAAIVYSLAMCGEYPPDIETLVSVGFSEKEALVVFEVVQDAREKMGEIIAQKRKEAEADIYAKKNNP